MLSNDELFKLAADNGVGMVDGIATAESCRLIVTPLLEEDEDYSTYLAAYRAIAEAARRDALEEAARLCDPEMGIRYSLNTADTRLRLAKVIRALIDQPAAKHGSCHTDRRRPTVLPC